MKCYNSLFFFPDNDTELHASPLFPCTCIVFYFPMYDFISADYICHMSPGQNPIQLFSSLSPILNTDWWNLIESSSQSIDLLSPWRKGTVLHSYNSLIFLYSLVSSVLRRDATSFRGEGVEYYLMRVTVQRALQFVHTDGSTFVGQVCWMLHATILIARGG
jgi:hypothetical protein